MSTITPDWSALSSYNERLADPAILTGAASRDTGRSGPLTVAAGRTACQGQPARTRRWRTRRGTRPHTDR